MIAPDYATPEEAGLDSGALASLVDFGAGAELDSLLIRRHGRRVLDAYYGPFRPGERHRLNSATKGVVGTLVGLAIQRGILPGVDAPVLDFFPGRAIAADGPAKRAITIQHLLDMTAGLAWTESLMAGSIESVEAMQASPDWVQYVLDRPMAGPPGESFSYNSGATHLLSAILARATGGSPAEFARAQLFAPLGLAGFEWASDPQGLTIGGYGLALTPPDAARIGQLYLQDGVWAGARLLPPGWVEGIRRASLVMVPGRPLCYAKLFWVLTASDAYMAVGYHSQIILVLPDPAVVAVVTGRGPPRFPELIRGIKGAVRSAGPLPADGAAQAALAARIAAAARGPGPQLAGSP
jgi:CubicO group peptidase (beta-lactamase class C family)